MVEDPIIREYLSSNPDRPRGVLTERERRYYLGEDVVEEKSQAERTLRQNVRNRLTHAILDFSILAQQMEQRDVDRVFRAEVTGDRDDDPISTNYVRRSAVDLIALPFRHIDNPASFEQTVEDALERAALVAGHDARVAVDIDMELTSPLEEIADRLTEQGPEAVSYGELRALLDAGEITRTEHAEAVLEKEEDRSPRLREPDDEE